MRLSHLQYAKRNCRLGFILLLFFASALVWMSISSTAHADADRDVLVGVYYYGWYGNVSGGHSTDQSVGGHLIPKRQPAVGANYSSRDPNVIAAHLDQSHRANIGFWSLSWWGPNDPIDVTNLKHILTHPRVGEMKYVVHYESPGRLGNSKNTLTDYSNLLPDFRYLAKHYFNHPNYLHIDGKPVVNIYAARGYFDIPRAEKALLKVRNAIRDEFGYDLYLIGDDLTFSDSSLWKIRQWDAVTGYSPPNYVKNTSGDGVPNSYFQNIRKGYDTVLQQIARANALYGSHTQLIPSAGPGVNNTAVFPDHPELAAPVVPRYKQHDGTPEDGSLFRHLLHDISVPLVNKNDHHILLITSFNELHEATQIEAMQLSQITCLDDSVSGSQFTKGYLYSGYGNLYLDILREATTKRVKEKVQCVPSTTD